MTGRFIGVGLGPGDTGLITLKAAQLIESAHVIAYPTLAGGDSFARSIAAARNAAWVVLVDDDSYVYPSRLASLLHGYNPCEPQLLGELKLGGSYACGG